MVKFTFSEITSGVFGKTADSLFWKEYALGGIRKLIFLNRQFELAIWMGLYYVSESFSG